MGIFEKKENAVKKVKKIQSGILGLFWTAIASRLSSIDRVAMFQSILAKKPQKTLKMGIRRLKKNLQ